MSEARRYALMQELRSNDRQVRDNARRILKAAGLINYKLVAGKRDGKPAKLAIYF